MNASVLAAIPVYAQLLVVVTTIVSVLLIIIVLLQKGKGGGLSAAFGGAGGQSAFGGKTGDVFTWATIIGAALFLVLAMVSTAVYKPVIETQERVVTPSLPVQGGAAAPAPTATTPATTETAAPVSVEGPAVPAAAAPEADTAAEEPIGRSAGDVSKPASAPAPGH